MVLMSLCIKCPITKEEDCEFYKGKNYVQVLEKRIVLGIEMEFAQVIECETYNKLVVK